MGSAASNPFAASDAELVRAGDAMVTAGGILALGETATTVVTTGLGIFAQGDNSQGMRSFIMGVGLVGSLGTLIVGARVFDVKRRGLI
jgi:hypothetical protein